MATPPQGAAIYQVDNPFVLSDSEEYSHSLRAQARYIYLLSFSEHLFLPAFLILRSIKSLAFFPTTIEHGIMMIVEKYY